MSTPPRHYHPVTKAFHWLTAVLILIAMPLGFIANDWAYDTDAELATKAMLFSAHKTLGVTIFAVALLRILWALTQAKPGAFHPERRAETFLAETVHWVLYGALVLVPLTGWIEHAATSGFAPILWPFGQGLPFVPQSEAVAETFAAAHGILTKVLAAAVLLHIAGALKHHVVDRDATLRRMWFGRGEIPAAAPHRRAAAAPLAALAIFALSAVLALAFAAQDEAEAAPVAALAEVDSDWQVTDGTLSITVEQLGSPVTGTFADWTAEIDFDPAAAPDFGAVTVTVNIASLTLGSVTDQAMGRDFFDVANHPTATFSGPITAEGEGYVVAGELALKGVTAPLRLPFTLALDGDTARMEATASVDRLTFGVGETMPDETNLAFPVVIDVALTATRGAP